MIRTEHREKEWRFPFVLYSPSHISDGLPLVIQLHGAGERGNGIGEALALVDVNGFSKTLKDTETEALVVMPQCPKEGFWAGYVESLIAFIDRLIAFYKVDRKRVYLTGLSMGGFGTWFCAMARPGMFAAIAPVCGGGMPWNAGVLDMPVWTFHGSEDNVVSPILTEQMVEALIKSGRNVKFTRLDGVAHNAWDYAYNKCLLDWLLSQKRS